MKKELQGLYDLCISNGIAESDLKPYFATIESNLKTKRYGLVWEEQLEDIASDLKNKFPILVEREDLSISADPNGLTNCLIEGDNYESLTFLNNSGVKVDCIYIDPPYNTGNKDFVYNDKYIDSEDTWRHSSWLSFMNKRLKLAKELLTEDGVIFISIDDNEAFNLKLLCDSVFGEDNFIANLIVNVAPAGSQSSKHVAMQHNYCFMYRKSCFFNSSTIPLTYDQIREKYIEKDNNGDYYTDRIWKRGVGGKKEDSPSLHFPVYYDVVTENIYIDEEIDELIEKDNIVKIIPYHTIGVLGRWTWSKRKMKSERDMLKVKITSGEYKLYKKVYSKEDKGTKIKSILTSDIGRTELGSLEIKEVMGHKAFQYPKYSGFIKHLLYLHPNKNATVLDFFAGSGTTGHAVLALNKEDGGNRHFILCTNNENNIAEEVTYERLKRVITGYTTTKGKEVLGIPSNLKYYKVENVGTSVNPMEIEDEVIENIIPFIQFKHNVWDQETVAEDLIALTNETESVFVYSNTLYLCDGFYESINSSVKHTTLYIYDGLFEFLDEERLVNVDILSITNEFYKN